MYGNDDFKVKVFMFVMSSLWFLYVAFLFFWGSGTVEDMFFPSFMASFILLLGIYLEVISNE